MARNNRQSKILEIISTNEVETQEELVASLKAAGYDVTQATISRDIKELGLIKIMSDSKKYKYATVSASVQPVSNKIMSIFKECVVSVKCAMNLVVVKVLKGTAAMVSDIVDGMSMSQVMGSTFGDDTVMVIASDVDDAYYIKDKLSELLK
ncbi:MAG: arginine repressor [Clostridia bacterium]|nr:arginine repressor [Clostridia bacterium]